MSGPRRRLLRYAPLFSSLCIGLCLSLWYCFPVSAASITHHALTILSESATTSFPTAINFQLRVQDSIGPVTQATLLLSDDLPDSTFESHKVTIETIGAITAANYQESIDSSHFFIPGSHISYYWALQDANGTYYLPNEQITVTDTRFKWQEAAQGLVHLHWYNQGADAGQAYLAQAVAHVKRISVSLGGSLHSPIDLWIYRSHADMLGALPPDVREWVGGIAFPFWNESFIVASSPDDLTMVRDMPHELTHLIFHQITALYMNIPTWFDEGLAMYNQPYHESDLTQVFTSAVATHTLIPFASLGDGFPADSEQAYLAYAQSWKLVSYMYTTFGQRKMVAFIGTMNDVSRSFDDDMQQTLGVDSSGLEKQWLRSLSSSTISVSTQQQTTTANLNDPNAPLYLSLGVLLIVLPIAGGIALFFYMRRANARVQSIAYVTTTPVQPVSAANSPSYHGMFRSENSAHDERPLSEHWIPERADLLTGETTDIYGVPHQD